MTLQKFRADILYGASKCYKTSNLGRACEYYFSKTGRRGRVVTADGGGYEPIEGLVQAGMLEVWALNEWPNPIEAMDLACQGWWPRDLNDIKSTIEPPTPDTWARVGFYGFEGLTSFGDLILRNLRDTKARLSQDPAYTIKFGTHEYSGSNMSYYGFVQDRLYDYVMKTQMLPVERVVWTALEGKGEEEGTKTPIYGPSIAGRKSIGKAPQWFGNCLHVELLITSEKVDPVTKQLSQEQKVVMYLRPHADPLSKVAFPAGTRAPYQYAKEVPEYMEPDLAKLYELLDKLRLKSLADFQKVTATQP